MFFISLVYLAALTLEAIGSYISVVGLAAKTTVIIIFLAITLDFSKVVIASVLYKKWKSLHLLLKMVLLPVLIFLIGVTSTGAYAYLMQEFNKTTAGVEQQKVQLSNLENERNKLESRKQDIDTQISQLPNNAVTSRKRLTDLFAAESQQINTRLNALSQDIPNLQQTISTASGTSGTLGSIASAYNVSPEQVSRIIAFFIVIVIDPLAIVLLTVANFLVEQRKTELKIANPPPTNPWDKFRATLFGSKSKYALNNKTIILPFTDSTGHLIKNVLSLSPHSFIDKADLFITEPIKIDYNKANISTQHTLSTYIQPMVKLEKSTLHLTRKNFITALSIFDSTIELDIKKGNVEEIVSVDSLQHKTIQPMIRDEINLEVTSLIKSVEIQDEKVIPLSLFKKDYIKLLEENNLMQVVNGEPISTYEDSENKIEENTVNNDTIKETPKSVDLKKMVSSEDLFKNMENKPYMNTSAYVEDISVTYDTEDIDYWAEDDYHFETQIDKPTIENDIEGFNLKELNHNF